MLCDTCSHFDIEALYSAVADLVKKQPPRERSGNVFTQYDGIPDFYKHQPSLAALRASATDGCELCNMIWSTYSDNKSEEELTEKLEALFGVDDQIYLGLSQWSPKSHGFPYFVAVQYARIVRPLATFEAFAHKEHFPAGFEHLLAKEVASSPASAACLGLASGWLRDCIAGHKTCKKLVGSKKLPTRVLDVGPADGSQEPCLKITNGLKADWIALSYCWGGDSIFILKQERLQQWQDKIPLDSFPATLRDAIIITRSLGVQYLWIDALCIIQDSKEDWTAEAAKMGDVYQGAIVTVSAVASPKTDHGIFENRKPVGKSCQIPWGPSGSTSVRLVSGTTFWDGAQKNSPLNTRGWTLQESLLAPRTLSYGSQQMLWECQELRIDEAGRPIAAGEEYRDKQFLQSLLNSRPSSTGKFLRKNIYNKLAVASDRWNDLSQVSENLYGEWQQPYTKWLDIVIEYTSRNFKVATDVLPALGGLAAAFQPVLGDQYCAGLWRNDMIRGLIWDRRSHERGVEPRYRNKKTYKAPSWSWASIEGRRATFNSPDAADIIKEIHKAKILDVVLETSSNNAYGQIKRGHMIVQGLLCSIDNPLEVEASARFPLLQADLYQMFASEQTLMRAELDIQHEAFQGQKFAALQLRRYTTNNSTTHDGQDIFYHAADFLILETIASDGDDYRRVALYRISSYSTDTRWDMTVELLKEIDRFGSKDIKVKVV